MKIGYDEANLSVGVTVLGFVIMFVTAWAAVLILYSMDKGLSFIENVFLYLVILTIGIHVSWVIAEEFKLVEITRDGLSYTGYLLYRTVAFPIFFVILINIIFKSKKIAVALITAGLGIAVILSLHGVLLFYRILEYKRWNLFYEAIHIALLFAVGYGLLKAYRKLVYREVNAS
ncbi:hypothetical protein [Paenibacillus sp.]|uniref:hypothetical protein n=1 Tax=Paenibacillus sp. TaxID=58172 RepID=UPI002D65E8AB|nr:hypothetical protein [Paenibacillus sp.]HZG84316.1 hypothetical protein [Paenibacillus sp.]